MTEEELLESTDLFLLDLDGTVYLSEKPIGDMIGTLSRLRKMGKRIGYLTNNCSKTVREYEVSLRRIGILFRTFPCQNHLLRFSCVDQHPDSSRSFHTPQALFQPFLPVFHIIRILFLSKRMFAFYYSFRCVQ